jgi:hypothetical protein
LFKENVERYKNKMILIQKYTKETRNRIYLIQDCSLIQKTSFSSIKKYIQTKQPVLLNTKKYTEIQYTVYFEYICKHTKLQKIGIHSWLLATYSLKYAKVELLGLREICYSLI